MTDVAKPILATNLGLPVIASTTNTTTNTSTTLADDKKTSIATYIIIAVVCVLVIAAIWYGYSRFTKNQESNSSFSNKPNKNAPEQDQAIINYNIHDAIAELEQIQAEVLKNVSSNVNI